MYTWAITRCNKLREEEICRIKKKRCNVLSTVAIANN